MDQGFKVNLGYKVDTSLGSVTCWGAQHPGPTGVIWRHRVRAGPPGRYRPSEPRSPRRSSGHSPPCSTPVTGEALEGWDGHADLVMGG